MRCYVIIILILIGTNASALTVSPMLSDQVTTKSSKQAIYKIVNNYSQVMEYEIWLDRGKGTDKLYLSKFLVGGSQSELVTVPIWNITADKMEVFRVCIKEKSVSTRKVGILARVCARLRLYWPAAQLQVLQ